MRKSMQAPWKLLEPRRRAFMLGAAMLFCSLVSGCAAITNPVANGLPVRRLPPDFLGEPREAETQIPLTLLGQKPPDVYRLAPGDVMGVWIEGVLGTPDQNPPSHFPTQGFFAGSLRLPPATGFPILVRENGTISLPLVKPIRVEGLSLEEAEEAVRQTYAKTGILKAGREGIIVSLIRPRQFRVSVVRQEVGGLQSGANGVVVGTGGEKLGTGHLIDLFAYENDVLHALMQTGGLPGLDAYDEVIIHRAASLGERVGPDGAPPKRDPLLTCTDTIRIPLRVRPGEPVPFGPQDVLLESGDVVYIAARYEFFYTGGLLPSGEHIIPRDYDLDVVEAVTRVAGPLINGGVGANNLSGALVSPGLGFPSPSLLTVLRRTPGGGQVPIRVDLNRALRDPRERILVQPGDVLILQETPGEAIGRYLSQVFNLNIVWQVIDRGDVQGTATVSVP